MLRTFSFIILFASLFSSRCFSQVIIEEEAESGDSLSLSSSFKDSTHITRLLLIPFEKSMYTSDADREIMLASKINYQQLVFKFRLALMVMLKNRISSYYETKNLIEEPVRDSINYLARVYQGIGYKSVNQGFFGKMKNRENESPISKGQLVIRENNNPKYTKVVISDKKILELMNDQLGSDMFVFISMFEIKNDLSDYTQVGTNTYHRTMNVHFNIINSKGKDMGGDIASATFSSKTNKIDEIIKKTFPEICEQILMKTPQPKVIKKEKIAEKKDGN